jgi:chromosome partitioning protein
MALSQRILLLRILSVFYQGENVQLSVHTAGKGLLQMRGDEMTLNDVAGQPGLEAVARHGLKMLERLRKTASAPNSQKSLKITFSISEAAKLLGCSLNRIRAAEEDGRLPKPAADSNHRRLGYSVGELLNMRQVLGASPARPPSDPAAIVAIQNFKGGVGKSTLAVHFAHRLAIKGYRVLVVDCDSQATTTTLFGFNPHLQILQRNTLYPFLALEPTESDLNYAVLRTPWPNVDLIPSCLELFDIEYELAAVTSSGENILASRFHKLREGLQTLSRNYDVILLDPPPALGTVSLTVMQAATSLLIPLTPSMPDFASTVQFLNKLIDIVSQMEVGGIHVRYDFVRMMCSRHNTNDPSQAGILSLMDQTFGSYMLPLKILDSSEVGNAALRMMSIYELEEPIGTPRTYKRCKENMDAVLDQVEDLIRSKWADTVMEGVAHGA